MSDCIEQFCLRNDILTAEKFWMIITPSGTTLCRSINCINCWKKVMKVLKTKSVPDDHQHLPMNNTSIKWRKFRLSIIACRLETLLMMLIFRKDPSIPLERYFGRRVHWIACQKWSHSIENHGWQFSLIIVVLFMQDSFYLTKLLAKVIIGGLCVIYLKLFARKGLNFEQASLGFCTTIMHIALILHDLFAKNSMYIIPQLSCSLDLALCREIVLRS